MAKIPRVFQKIFGSSAGPTEIGVFGSYAAGVPANTADAAVAMSLSNWLGGWLSAVVGVNAPAIEDMNAFCFVVTTQLAYLYQAGIPEWDASTTYYIGSLVNSSGVIFKSLTNTNLNNAVTSTTDWAPLDGSLFTSADADRAIALAESGGVIEMTAVTADRTGTLPAANTAKGKKFTIVRTDAGAGFDVIVTDGTYTRRLEGQYDSLTVFSNGTVYYAI